jgi:hypothetical protein
MSSTIEIRPWIKRSYQLKKLIHESFKNWMTQRKTRTQVRNCLCLIKSNQSIKKIVRVLSFEKLCKKTYDEMLPKKFRSIENILFFKEKLWASESDQLKLDIIREIHDQSTFCQDPTFLQLFYQGTGLNPIREGLARISHKSLFCTIDFLLFFPKSIFLVISIN